MGKSKSWLMELGETCLLYLRQQIYKIGVLCRVVFFISVFAWCTGLRLSLSIFITATPLGMLFMCRQPSQMNAEI